MVALTTGVETSQNQESQVTKYAFQSWDGRGSKVEMNEVVSGTEGLRRAARL